MRKIIAATTLAATAILAGGGGYVLHSQASPASCRVAGSSLPSGDAIKIDAHGSAWTAGTSVAGPYTEDVCTDGEWVHVAQYGA